MARAAIDWNRKQLAEAAGLNVNTVSNFENGAETLASTVRKLQAALESAGVVFVEPNGHGPGVRLRQPDRT